MPRRSAAAGARRSPRPALRLERQVEVLQLLLLPARLQPRAQRVRQLPLLVDARDHRLAPLRQLAEVAPPLLDLPDLGLVERAGALLAIAGDERDGGAF